MTYVIKNEEDIIERNIRFHARYGVDAFLVVNHGSTDNTNDILAELKKEFDITVHQKSDETWEQAKWATEATIFAGSHLGANWVINNDADEFWMPDENDQTIKNFLLRKQYIIQVNRFNMLPTAPDIQDGTFWNFSWYVKHPILYALDVETDFKYGSYRELLYRQGDKIIVRPAGLVSINKGAHAAEHFGAMKQQPVKKLKIFHYPVRSYKTFEQRIIARKTYWERHQAPMGTHLRNWLKSAEQNSIQQLFDDSCITGEALQMLQDFGVLAQNERLRQAVQSSITS